MRAAIVLGDFAEVDSASGKVHILGAGWSMTGPGPSTQAVVAFLQVPPDRVGEPIPVILRLLDRAHRVVEVPGNLGAPQRLEITGQVVIREPEGWDHSTELEAVFSVNLLMLLLPPGHSYTWSIEVDGKELANTEFQTRSSPPPPEVTRTITYRGYPARASQLAQMLEEEGVDVEWTRPTEERGLGADAAQVVIQMVATGGVLGITAAVNKFRARVKHAKVTIEGEDEEPSPEAEPPE